jgi:hypothetical protein
VARRQRTEVIDGREYVVTTLPQDRRLMPSQARKRTLWDALSPAQKAAEIRKRKQKARRKRRRRRSASAAQRTSG